MNLSRLPYLFAVTLCIFTASTFADNNEQQLLSQARTIAKTYASTLKPQLKQSIQTGGLEHAVTICAEQAPKIAEQLSRQTGWQVKRVSLKPRNKATATTDDFERYVLDMFEQLQKYSPKSTYEHSAMTDTGFRYMQAQVVQGICLNCHGSSLPSHMKKVIEKAYPEDKATGYQLGQIRGAISLSKH